MDDELWATAMHLLTPDAPVSMYGEVAEFAPGYEGLKRTFIRCNQDQTIVNSTCEAIVADMNAAWPSSPTPPIDLESSHEAMFSKPEALPHLIVAAAEG